VTIDEHALDAILPGVEKPARYTGNEYNSVVKDWDGVAVRLALAFPDIYELGMSNLGLAILYDIVNRRPDALAERVYLPWPDMQAAMRRAGLPLYALESRRPLREFDLIGISLPYVQLYTNTLSLLDLAGLPLRGAERDARHPLVIAGGSAVYNPEPMADFIDAFVIGEGEEVILEILDAFRSVGAADRETQLRRLAGVPGVYVPRYYRPRHTADGRLLAIEPIVSNVPAAIVKRIVPVLPPPVTRFVVPFVGAVFDRAAVEIQRGCTRGCRFCQAGAVFRPVRERPPGEIIQAVEDIVRHTGYQEISLLSLSSTDYTGIEALVRCLLDNTRDGSVSLSLPSSRIESVTVTMIDLLTRGRRTGFTFAPEAATDRLRDVVNKPIPTAELLELAEAVFSRGWRSLKLYFMIGQPTETDADVDAIAELARAVLEVGRRHHRNKAQVRVGVSTFVPQPHTPFQWAAMDAPEAIRRKQEQLRRAFGRRRGILFNWNDPRESLLEAALVRGDRRVGPAILSAWRQGCQFDAWQEHFKHDAWSAAFAAHGLDQDWYATRAREADEVLPWDHIETGVSRRWLWADYQAALRGEVKVDCRHGCHGCGILTAFAAERRAGQADEWQCPPAAATAGLGKRSERV
jgi:radical SAM family uncharacterized protein